MNYIKDNKLPTNPHVNNLRGLDDAERLEYFLNKLCEVFRNKDVAPESIIEEQTLLWECMNNLELHLITSVLQRVERGRPDFDKNAYLCDSDDFPYEVYVAEDSEGKPMYIGEGKRGRHAHLTSGASNCVEANKHVLTGGTLDIVIHLLPTKAAARKMETELIQKLQPPWNKKGKKKKHD